MPCAVNDKLPDELLVEIIRATELRAVVNLLSTNRKLWERRGDCELWKGRLSVLGGRKPCIFASKDVSSRWASISKAGNTNCYSMRYARGSSGVAGPPPSPPTQVYFDITCLHATELQFAPLATSNGCCNQMDALGSAKLTMRKRQCRTKRLYQSSFTHGCALAEWGLFWRPRSYR